MRVTQALSNLLNNAAKYTANGGQIWVAARRQGQNVIVSIRDNGIGIPAEMLTKVFDLFSQVDPTYSRAQGGLGVGLSISRRLVEMHRGTLEAVSEGLGKASEFTLRLPLLAGHLEQSDQDHLQDRVAPVGPRRILVVDDNRDAAEVLGLLLEHLGAVVHTANDGLTALEAFQIFRPSVVLLDIGMPGMDGYELARRLRAQKEGSNVVLVAPTGWGLEQARELSKEAGIDHYMVKPLDTVELQKLLDWL